MAHKLCRRRHRTPISSRERTGAHPGRTAMEMEVEMEIRTVRRVSGEDCPDKTILKAYGADWGLGRRYYASVDEGTHWPPEIVDYNNRFTKLLQTIKHRHDPVVTTMGTIPSCCRVSLLLG